MLICKSYGAKRTTPHRKVDFVSEALRQHFTLVATRLGRKAAIQTTHTLSRSLSFFLLEPSYA